MHAVALASHLAELRDGLALARALRRTLVLPRWPSNPNPNPNPNPYPYPYPNPNPNPNLNPNQVLPRWLCYCDRLWSPSDDIFHFGCMYPGAQDGKFLPFVCPMDHVLSPTDWQQAGQLYRDAAFLDHLPPASIAEVSIIADQGPPRATSALGGAFLDAARPSLSAGLSDTEAARRLQPLSEVPVLLTLTLP